ncbi:MAG: T9SS type A sorting domain-containing protein, partial [Bacteroidota bacterium]
LDSAGNFVWAYQLGGVSSETGKSIATDASGNVYTTGSFSYITDFDPGSGVYNLTSIDSTPDAFIHKIRQGTVGFNSIQPANSDILVYPNPATNILKIAFTAEKAENYSVEIFDVTGRLIISKTGELSKNGNVIDINISMLSRGIYTMQFMRDETKEQRKIILQ